MVKYEDEAAAAYKDTNNDKLSSSNDPFEDEEQVMIVKEQGWLQNVTEASKATTGKSKSAWLYTLTEDCIEQSQGQESYSVPIQLCERVGSLFMAGGFVSLAIIITYEKTIYLELLS